jgi:anti-anti-sigma factor
MTTQPTTTTHQTFSFRVAEYDEWTRVVLKGAIDVSTAPRFLGCLQESLGRNPKAVILDLLELDYIDSVGLGVLVTGHKRAKATGTRFVLSKPKDTFRRLLELTGLNEVFEVDNSG